MRTAIHLSVVIIACVVLSPLQGFAHEIRPAIAELVFNEGLDFEITISVNLEALIADIGIGHDDTEASANAGEYNRLRALPPGQLRAVFDQFLPRFLSAITLSAGKERLALGLIDVEIAEIGDFDLARDSRVLLAGRLPAGARLLTWTWATAFGDSVIRLRETGVNAGSREGDITYAEYLQAGAVSEPFSINLVPEQRAIDVFVDYVKIGFTHILPKGLDHILFIVGLFLLTTRLSALLWQITSFTLAHSITLAMGMFGMVQVLPGIVEPLIAASIVYVCVENTVTDKLHAWRPLVVFAFGLLHGLGFAGVLNQIGLQPTQFITGLVAFNVGVELGQIGVVIICFLTVGLWFRNKTWYRAVITLPLSAMIALIGAWWFVERTLL